MVRNLNPPSPGAWWQRPAVVKAARIALQVAVVAGCVAFARTLDWIELAATARTVSAWHFVVGAGCAFLNLFGKGTSWWFLLGRPPRLSLLALWGMHLRSAAGNIVLPLRAGEGLRVMWLSQALHRTPAAMVRIALTEKVINLATLAALVAPAAWWLPETPAWLQQGLAVVFGVAALGGAATWANTRNSNRQVGREGMQAAAAESVTPPGTFGGPVQAPRASEAACAVATSLLGWVGDAVLVSTIAHGVGAALPWWQAPLVLMAINVAIALPSTPAHVGTMELAATTAMMVLGVGKTQAASFAVLYHAVQVMPVLAAAGLVEAVRRARRVPI